MLLPHDGCVLCDLAAARTGSSRAESRAQAGSTYQRSTHSDTVSVVTDFDLDGMFVEPRPGEDAWEAFMELALERIGGERSSGLSNRQIGDLEGVLGCQLPFEIGLMLVMAVPSAEPWRQWSDPVADWSAWNEHLVAGFAFGIEHNDVWSIDWGPKPATLTGQIDALREQLDAAPALFPIYGNHVVPLTAAEDQANSDGNPIMLIEGSTVALLGDDLAAWMHGQFEVPLPMWPAEARAFPFWSALVD